jgi:hypothetical protein
VKRRQFRTLGRSRYVTVALRHRYPLILPVTLRAERGYDEHATRAGAPVYQSLCALPRPRGRTSGQVYRTQQHHDLGKSIWALEKTHVDFMPSRTMSLRKGQTRKSGDAIATSAHPPTTDIPQAASWAAMASQDDPDYQPALRIDAASNAMTGRPEQAHKAMARLRRLNPVLRVSNLKAVLGPWRADDLTRYEEGLRQAGLPE